MRKGQLTIFFIIGIILMIGISLFAVLNEKKTQFPFMQNTYEIQNIESYLSECLKINSMDISNNFALNGGYLKNAPIYLNTAKGRFTYLSFLNHDYAPTIEDVQNQFADEINYKLPFCIRNLEDFRKNGLNIDHGGMNANVKIFDSSILINIRYYLKVNDTKGNYKETNETSLNLKNRLGALIRISNLIIKDQISDSSTLGRSYFEEIEKKENVSIYIYRTYENRTFVYSIRDTLDLPGNQQLNFQFANKFENGKVPVFE